MVMLVAPLGAFLTVALLILTVFTPKRSEVQEKLKPYDYRAVVTADALARPFSERVLFPLLEKAGRLAGATTPGRMQERIQESLNRAGDPLSINAFLALRAVGMVILPGIYLGWLLAAGRSLGGLSLAGVLFLGGLGVYAPSRWLSGKASSRQRAIERSLPDALDLIVVSMEAGLAFDAALNKVVEKTRGPLKDELRRTLHEVQLGKPRRQALRQLGVRTGVKDLMALMNSVVQADQMGVSMAQVMRTQADEARLKRRQRAEEQAHQAAVKMLFPLVLFILPSVMIVTIGPAALLIYRQLAHGFGA